MTKPDRSFFDRNTLKVARDLLGMLLVRKHGKKTLRGMIVETEAYMGPLDLASHASRGKTPRTEIMFGSSGLAYIYMIYGMYYCFNVVTQKKGFPAAVLIRAADISNQPGRKSTENSVVLTNGPGKLCRYFKIDRSLNGEDLIKSQKLWIENKGTKISNREVVARKRIGVDYAKHCKHYPWRFYVKNNQFVSKI